MIRARRDAPFFGRAKRALGTFRVWRYEDIKMGQAAIRRGWEGAFAEEARSGSILHLRPRLEPVNFSLTCQAI